MVGIHNINRLWKFEVEKRKCVLGSCSGKSTHTNPFSICGDLPEGVSTTRDLHSFGCFALSQVICSGIVKFKSNFCSIQYTIWK